MDLTQQARNIIDTSLYLTLATADKNPWVAPLFFARDESYNFYFISSVNSLHAKQIQKNPHVAVAIFDSRQKEGTGTGLQIEATCSLLEESEYEKIIPYYLKKHYSDEKERAKHAFSSEQFKNSEKKIFKIVPIKCYIPDDESWKKYKIDRRIEVKLK